MSHRDLSKFSDVLFRLDADEGVVGLSTHLTNLSRLMENCQDRWAQERAIIRCQSESTFNVFYTSMDHANANIFSLCGLKSLPKIFLHNTNK